MRHTPVDLSADAIKAFRAALVTRGPNEGRLLAKAPPSHTMAYGAWMGAMLSCDPFRVGAIAFRELNPEQRDILKAVTRWLDALPELTIAFERPRRSKA
jgi:hypothetical protein